MLTEVTMVSYLKNLAGAERVEVELEAATSLREVLGQVCIMAAGPVGSKIWDSDGRLMVLVSIDGNRAGLEDLVHPGDKIKIMPPFAGG